MKVLVKAPVSTYTGYGNDGIGLVQALLRWGVDLYLLPTNVEPPLPRDVAGVLTKSVDAPFDLVLHHLPPGQLGLTDVAASAEVSDLTVGWSMWEYTTFDNMNPGKDRRSLRRRLKDYHAILPYDPVSAQAFSTVYKGPMLTLQGGYDPTFWQPPVERDWTGRIGFCMVGQLHIRKDPFAAIEAFNQLKMDGGFDDAELHLKTSVEGLPRMLGELIPKLRVHYDLWPQDILRSFYHSQHVLLAPSRGEGKNVPAMEAMTTGMPVVATNWGGHTQWISDQYAYPIDYVERPQGGDTPNCLQARASVEHLKEIMWNIYTNRAEAKRKGEIASRMIPQMCSWDAVVERLFRRLDEIKPGLWALASSCHRSPVEAVSL